jgi:predicted nucleotidyltransferase
MNIHDLIETKREEILKIAAKHGARNVRIIGSVARHEDDSHSDIDMLVELESGRTLLDHSAMILELEELLGIKVDVASDRGLRDRIKRRIMKEALPL